MPSHETSVRAEFEKWFNARYYTIDPIGKETAFQSYAAGMARMREDAKHEALEELRKMSLEEFLAFALPAAPSAEGEK
jgi:hypothetical protein